MNKKMSIDRILTIVGCLAICIQFVLFLLMMAHGIYSFALFKRAFVTVEPADILVCAMQLILWIAVATAAYQSTTNSRNGLLRWIGILLIGLQSQLSLLAASVVNVRYMLSIDFSVIMNYFSILCGICYVASFTILAIGYSHPRTTSTVDEAASGPHKSVHWLSVLWPDFRLGCIGIAILLALFVTGFWWRPSSLISIAYFLLLAALVCFESPKPRGRYLVLAGLIGLVSIWAIHLIMQIMPPDRISGEYTGAMKTIIAILPWFIVPLYFTSMLFLILGLPHYSEHLVSATPVDVQTTKQWPNARGFYIAVLMTGVIALLMIGVAASRIAMSLSHGIMTNSRLATLVVYMAGSVFLLIAAIATRISADTTRDPTKLWRAGVFAVMGGLLHAVLVGLPAIVVGKSATKAANCLRHRNGIWTEIRAVCGPGVTSIMLVVSIVLANLTIPDKDVLRITGIFIVPAIVIYYGLMDRRIIRTIVLAIISQSALFIAFRVNVFIHETSTKADAHALIMLIAVACALGVITALLARKVRKVRKV